MLSLKQTTYSLARDGDYLEVRNDQIEMCSCDTKGHMVVCDLKDIDQLIGQLVQIRQQHAIPAQIMDSKDLRDNMLAMARQAIIHEQDVDAVISQAAVKGYAYEAGNLVALLAAARSAHAYGHPFPYAQIECAIQHDRLKKMVETPKADEERLLKDALFACVMAGRDSARYGGVEVENGVHAWVHFFKAYADGEPDGSLKHPHQPYIDSYRQMASQGDGKVHCSSVAADIEQNMTYDPKVEYVRTNWQPYLSVRADGVRGHYAVARWTGTYAQYLNVLTGEWSSVAERAMTREQALAVLENLVYKGPAIEHIPHPRMYK